MGNKGRLPVLTGGMLVLCVLAVASMAVFATLTLVSARADMRLSRENAEFHRAYYEAEYQAALRVNGLQKGAGDAFVIAIDERMALSVIARDGAIAEWKLIDTGETDTPDDTPLPVWEGE